MAAKSFLKPLRTSYLTMLGGIASTLGLGQAMFLKATYQSPPDARGPRSGVEKSSSSTSSATPVFNTSSASASSTPSPSPPRSRSTSTSPSPSPSPPAIVQTGGAEALEPGGNDNKQILVIGDSLVSGVGGISSFEDGPSDGPALPRQVARSLSELLRANVSWKSMSLTGGDVRMLRRKIVPMLRRERTRGTLGPVSAIVLVTGVNDWKRFSPSRTAEIFKTDLKLFIDDIQAEVGDDCVIILPAIPGVRHTPRFHEPLRSIVIFLNELWDGQKLLLARSMRNVFFVGQPANNEWGNDPLIYFSTLDRVHPSELGYTVWAERIAKVMRDAFAKIKGNVLSSVGNAAAATTTTASTPAAGSAGTSTSSNIQNNSNLNSNTLTNTPSLDAFNQTD